jgi:hypothetical protein
MAKWGVWVANPKWCWLWPSQTVLVPGRHQAKSSGRANWRVGIAIRELQAICGQLVEHRRHFAKRCITTTVTSQIGKPQVVGHDEDDVRAFHALSP